MLQKFCPSYASVVFFFFWWDAYFSISWRFMWWHAKFHANQSSGSAVEAIFRTYVSTADCSSLWSLNPRPRSCCFRAPEWKLVARGQITTIDMAADWINPHSWITASEIWHLWTEAFSRKSRTPPESSCWRFCLAAEFLQFCTTIFSTAATFSSEVTIVGWPDPGPEGEGGD